MPRSRPLSERFHEKVDRQGPDECWPWKGVVDLDGYGKIREGVPGHRKFKAHRVAYKLHRGELQDDQCVLHECDNPPCCNPRHLFLGTQIDNIQDMDDKRRRKVGRGERHGNVKLTEKKIQSIREEYVRGSSTYGTTALAQKHGVHHTTIGHIVRKDNWTHV